MALPFNAAPTSSREDLSKRARKPYTITKCRESWTEPEHDKFLEAIQLYNFYFFSSFFVLVFPAVLSSVRLEFL